MRSPERILDVLAEGRANVVSSHCIARELGEPQRSVGFAVSSLRRRGHLVGSVHGEGYYLIRTEGELDETIAHIERRKAGIDETIRALRSTWDES